MRKKPFFQKVLSPILILIFSEILIFTICVFGRGLIQELKKNEVAVVKEQVISRKGNIENYMLNSWMNVDRVINGTNAAAQKLLEEKKVSAEAMCEDTSISSDLLLQMTPLLLNMMQTNHVTGAFIVLNTQDLEPSMKAGKCENKYGVYLKNNDPTASWQNTRNVLVLRSPLAVAQKLDLALDSKWDVNFDFANKEVSYYDFFYRPFQAAYENDGKYSWRDLGCWSAPYHLYGEGQDAITYSVPLILEDGTVYGVMGIDISLDYFQNLLVNSELSGHGTYFLGQYNENKTRFASVFGDTNQLWVMRDDSGEFYADKEKYFLYTESLHLYENNTPFAEEEWVLAAVVPYSNLYSFVNELQIGLVAAILLSLTGGILGSILISYKLQLPLAKLVKELQSQDPRDYIHLKDTGIREIDRMSEEVEHLSRNVLESGKKFSSILQMSSTWIAGFQIDSDENSLFTTENFFQIFGMNHIQAKDLTVEEFKDLLKKLEKFRIESGIAVDGALYEIETGKNKRFVRLKLLEDKGNLYGLAEDVTQTLLEKRILTHQRDHDSLTNLYNRRAFRGLMSELFERNSGEIGIGAYLMLDLDNLKYINDTYGHEYGDKYILQAAAAIDDGQQEKAYYARISGDEFNIFFYGYSSREEIEQRIRQLRARFWAAEIELPDGSTQKLNVSGGVAWYPQDSTQMDELSKYADYAMYEAKRTKKGEIWNFNSKFYVDQDSKLKNAAILTRLIANREIFYVFQPIANAHSGAVYGYEALMRPQAGTFPSVKEILDTARVEGKLNQIEELTWMLVLKKFKDFIESGTVSDDCHIFINSIPNQRLSPEREQEMDKEYLGYYSNVVMELTEEEQLNGINWSKKLERMREVGALIALDDYGSGYNGDKTLLAVSPDFIKADIEIVKDIHRNREKQTLMEYFVNYAHGNGKYVIAEGVETREELETVIRLGVDFLQGYYLARPSEIPGAVHPDALQVIQKIAKENAEYDVN